ncbi:baseplate J/gp47 family protein [Herminiimonas contaminans]|uniref:Baseplate J/gp47 family protein n=1 Tax=Herminiimonas contaminans TaxID=1111140 RepID=A0ABS0EXV1_9BURK|nr:baseplate J/gp47 family protein [Herminiimonas contaminans]MBF8179667.1 baseplate J/gp47 family protein [Herminiimonas contaminans]
MAMDIDDLRTLRDKAEVVIEAELPGTNARLRRSNLNIIAKVQAMFTHGMLQFVKEFLSQCLPWSMGFLLRQWASVWGVYPLAATYAKGPIIFTGNSDRVVLAGTELQTDDGREYVTLTEVTLVAGTATVTVEALLPGLAGNLAAGLKMTSVTTIDGVNDEAIVGTGGIVGGAEAESPESLYRRFVQKVQNPGHGGNDEDYKGWAMEVPGVTRVWVYGGLDGVDTVQIYFVRDDDVSIIPDAAEVAAVDAHIRAPGRKPVAASVGVYAPAPKVVNFKIKAFPNTVPVKAAIESELRDLLKREAVLAGTTPLSHFDEAISLAQGETDHIMSMPDAPVVCAINEIAVFGGIEWE